MPSINIRCFHFGPNQGARWTVFSQTKWIWWNNNRCFIQIFHTHRNFTNGTGTTLVFNTNVKNMNRFSATIFVIKTRFVQHKLSTTTFNVKHVIVIAGYNFKLQCITKIWVVGIYFCSNKRIDWHVFIHQTQLIVYNWFFVDINDIDTNSCFSRQRTSTVIREQTIESNIAVLHGNSIGQITIIQYKYCNFERCLDPFIIEKGFVNTDLSRCTINGKTIRTVGILLSNAITNTTCLTNIMVRTPYRITHQFTRCWWKFHVKTC